VEGADRLRVSAFYHAVAKGIEWETGQIAGIFLNLNHRGLSSALICCGNLVVTNELLPKIQGFGFDSLEKLIIEAEKLIDSAVTRIHQFY
jgi:probable nitrogen fixation protein